MRTGVVKMSKWYMGETGCKSTETRRTNLISQDLGLGKPSARSSEQISFRRIEASESFSKNCQESLRNDAANKIHFAEFRRMKALSKDEANKSHFAESRPRKASVRIVKNPEEMTKRTKLISQNLHLGKPSARTQRTKLISQNLHLRKPQ